MAKTQKRFHALGLMSGTSLDGLDVAWCQFGQVGKKWTFKILKATTLAYSKEWRAKLSHAHTLNADALLALHAEYGHWLGKNCRQFIIKNRISKLDCIASHGHTVFHQPQQKFTFQLGDGNAIHAEVGLPVVFDFRSLDVQLGGQGAPLVPIGDKHLFAEADVCLNLGGIANLSLEKSGKRTAFDICFANMGLNYLAEKVDMAFDKNGTLASIGKLNESLLLKLLAFYKPFKTKRLSLAREHFENGLINLLNDESLSVPDRLATFCESIAIKIAEAIPSNKKQSVLITGGGARNSFLMSRIRTHLGKKSFVHIPSTQIIDFKEALVFAFLGVLRLQSKINVLRSVTGSSRDSSSGILIGHQQRP
jgi:anhydro-N-acetylmuramic acid kinase